MALLHQATLSPTKLDLLAAWLPGRPWSAGGTGLRQVGAYRFDDPAGDVGVETVLVGTADGPVLHLPLTYRAAPLAGAQEYLIGTMEHSVLGPRWVYDGCGDPVWATTAAAAVLTGGTQVEMVVEMADGRRESREPTATVVGSGTPGAEVPVIDAVTAGEDGSTTVVRGGGLEFVVVRAIGTPVPGVTAPGAQTLTGRWAEAGPTVLVVVRAV